MGGIKKFPAPVSDLPVSAPRQLLFKVEQTMLVLLNIHDVVSTNAAAVPAENPIRPVLSLVLRSVPRILPASPKADESLRPGRPRCPSPESFSCSSVPSSGTGRNWL